MGKQSKTEIETIAITKVLFLVLISHTNYRFFSGKERGPLIVQSDMRMKTLNEVEGLC